VTQKAAAELKFKLDTLIYPVEAIQAAAYTFTDRAFVRIAQDGAGSVAIRFKAKSGLKNLEALSDAFHNELLHEALRLKVSQANQKIREYIVTKALVSAQEMENMLPSAPIEAPSPQGAPEESIPLVDAALEKEIEALLMEIEKSEPGAGDPLGVSVPWEQKHEAKKDASAPSAKKEP
jgi:His-Xaa-Ser system protein HxsD